MLAIHFIKTTAEVTNRTGFRDGRMSIVHRTPCNLCAVVGSPKRLVLIGKRRHNTGERHCFHGRKFCQSNIERFRNVKNVYVD